MKRFLFTSLIVLGISGGASAAVVANASFSFVTSDPITYVGSTLDQATSITFGAVTAGSPLGNFDCSVPANVGNCVPTSGDTVTLTNPIVPGSLINLQWSADAGTADRFSFTGSLTQTNRSTVNQLGMEWTGTFADADGFYTSNSAQVIITLNQAGGPGPTNAVSLSGTFATPATINLTTPEPATFALIGAALIGLTMMRRKKA
jgi:hypothetical protein